MALVKLDSLAKVFVVSVRMDSLGKTAKIVLDNVQYKVKLAKVNVMLAKSNHQPNIITLMMLFFADFQSQEIVLKSTDPAKRLTACT